MISVRPARPGDLRATSHIHRTQLPDGFFARLGEGFLRAYHDSFLRSPYGIALVTGSDAAPTGFLVGALVNREHYRFVARYCSARMAARGAVALLVRPPLAWLFVRTRAVRYARWVMRYTGRRLRRGRPGVTAAARAPAAGAGFAAPPSAVVEPPIAVLTHVAVDPAAQGTGAGRALVTAFIEAAREAGADEARLVTAANGPAEQFYDRLGWTAGAVRNGSGGSLVREYRWPLHENAAS